MFLHIHTPFSICRCVAWVHFIVVPPCTAHHEGRILIRSEPSQRNKIEQDSQVMGTTYKGNPKAHSSAAAVIFFFGSFCYVDLNIRPQGINLIMGTKLFNHCVEFIRLLLMLADSNDYLENGTTQVEKIMNFKTDSFNQTDCLYKW